MRRASSPPRSTVGSAGLAALLALSACSDELPDPAVVASPRIAAMRADPPAAPRGRAVVLVPLVVRPVDGNVDSRLVSWACALERGADPRDCVPPGTLEAPVFDAGAFALVTPRSTDAPEIVVHVALCTASDVLLASALDAIRCTDGARPSLAFKRVALLDDDAAPPTNPVVGPLRLVPSDACDPAAVRCRREVSATVESDVEDATRLVTDFLTTAGELDPFRVEGLDPVTEWTPPRQAPASVVFWAIARDGAGGVGWQESALAP